jgi:thymidine kinase
VRIAKTKVCSVKRSVIKMLTRQYLRVFFGPMWSGKTNRLIESVDRAADAFSRVCIIKHSIDTRHPTAVVARTGLSLPATLATADLASVPRLPGTLYAVDEAQFFGMELLPFAAAVLQQEGSALVVAGLDLDFARKPFGAVLQLAQHSLDPGCQFSGVELSVQRLAARCSFREARGGDSHGAAVACSRPALFSQRLHAGGLGTVLVGGGEFYQPACGLHHVCSPVSEEDWGLPRSNMPS